MSVSPFESRALRILEKRIIEEVSRHALNLSEGSAKGADAASTACAYHETVGMVRGMNLVKDWFHDVEDELVGRNRTPINQTQGNL